MKESETEIDDDFYDIKNTNLLNYKSNIIKNKNNNNNIIIQNPCLNIIAPEKELNIKKSNVDDIYLESRHYSFPKLDMNNCLKQTINGKEKEKIILENIKNESIMFKPDKLNKDKKYIIEYNNISVLGKKETNSTKKG